MLASGQQSQRWLAPGGEGLTTGVLVAGAGARAASSRRHTGTPPSWHHPLRTHVSLSGSSRTALQSARSQFSRTPRAARVHVLISRNLPRNDSHYFGTLAVASCSTCTLAHQESARVFVCPAARSARSSGGGPNDARSSSSTRFDWLSSSLFSVLPPHG